MARRVANAPPERNEARWLDGWRDRVAAYTATAPSLADATQGQYRVPPYLQSVSADRATVAWFSERQSPGTVRIGSDRNSELTSAPRLACELAYHLAEFRDPDAARSLPYRHEISLQDLQAGRSYRVDVEQDGEAAVLEVRTPDPSKARFVVYGDSETEPESTGAHVEWPAAGGVDDDRRYPADQTRGYAANLASIADRKPDFVAIAGDLVESGGEQRDWDEFWRQNAALAASVPIVPALGNHDYFGGPGDLGGYGGAASQRALAKFRSYFGRPNYYVLNHGPIALIVLDANDGKPQRSSADTNWYLHDVAPEWQEGSAQMAWLQEALAGAQANKAFTFVMFHPAPYSSGIHGRAPGTGETENFASGRPLQALTPLFLRYGVDAVFNGHDEMYEHSSLPGFETLTDGRQVEHSVHFFTVGIGGDGLRGPDPGLANPYSLFMADKDSPERYDANGILRDGGRHYGHLLIDIGPEDDGAWQARIEPVYLFPLMDAEGAVQSFEPRIYNDVVTLTSRHDD